ncbi:MAG: adenylyltransferase/cytidyltransferase family protein [Paludibacteraceae bacterium]|nr:adenylyltransferase/cytidyltransferase family protein [Paludibacteraceae bacterium]
MSSYLAFRYIEQEGMDFYEGLCHENIPLPNSELFTYVRTADDIDVAIQKVFDSLKGEKLGICLSGGMDSAILASYMRGCDAYTFRFLGGEYQKEELARAEYYAKYYNLKLHYVDINWETVEKCLEPVVREKNAPVHSIEPQLYQAALQAKQDGVTRLIVGESSDLIFGGMDQLLSKDWSVEDFQKRYTFLNPSCVLKESVDMSYLYERYRQGDRIDFLHFMDDVFSRESSSSYYNAFKAADMPYTDPYALLRMSEPLDLNRVRNGESKYLIRELMQKKYPEIPVPDKVPMPRPVDEYFKNWSGPKRPEFRRDIDMAQFTGNQKWQMYCLEYFLNMYEPLKIGYTTGVYDLFHIGHLNLLRKAKAQCDYLIVGVSTDELVSYKHKQAVIPFEERKEIVGSIKYVDEVVTQENMNKMEAWEKYHFNVMFVGDDWKGTDKWNKIETDLNAVGAEVVYFPYTKGTSSTLINETLHKLRKEK